MLSDSMLQNDQRVLLAACLLLLFAPAITPAEPLLSPLNRATELTKQGENLGLQQKVDDAIAAFNEASALYEKLLDQNPGDIACRQSLGSCYQKFGDMLVANNQLDCGLANYQKGLAIRQALAAQAPGDPDRLQDLAEGLARMGRVSLLQHRLSNSLEFYKMACSTGDRLIRYNPQNYGWISELAINQGWVGEILLLLNNYDEAADAFGLIVDTVKLWPSPGSSDLSWLVELAVNLDDAAALIVTKRKSEQALRIFEVAKDLRQQLVAGNAANTDFKRDLAVGVKQLLCRVLSQCGSLLITNRRYTDALDIYERARKMLNAAYEADPSDPTWGTDLIVVLEAIGYIFSAQKTPIQALNSYKEAGAILEKLRQLYPENHELEETFAGTELAQGKLLREQGKSTDARAAFEECSRILFHLSETGRLDDQGINWLHEADMLVRQPF